jgi:hypothetical protein
MDNTGIPFWNIFLHICILLSAALAFAEVQASNTLLSSHYFTNTIQKDSFPNQLVPPLKLLETTIGSFDAGDEIQLHFKTIKCGKLKEILVTQENQVLYSQTKIKGDLLTPKIVIPSAGKVSLIIHNERRLLPRRFSLLLEETKKETSSNFDPNVDLASYVQQDSFPMYLDTALLAREDTIFFNRINASHQVHQMIVKRPAKRTTLANVIETRIGWFQSKTFTYNNIQAGDTIIIAMGDNKQKLSEILLKENGVLQYADGNIIPRSITITAVPSNESTYELVLSNQWRFLPKKVSFQVIKGAPASYQTYQRDTLEMVDCEVKTTADSIVHFYSHSIRLSNTLNLEKFTAISLTIEIPDSIGPYKNLSWTYQLTPASLPVSKDSMINIEDIKDPFPSIKEYLCYQFTTSERDRRQFMSKIDQCRETYDNYYSETDAIPLEGINESVFFFAKNINQGLPLNANLNLFAKVKVPRVSIIQCPKYIFNPVTQINP